MKHDFSTTNHALRWFGLTILASAILLAACAPAATPLAVVPTLAATNPTQAVDPLTPASATALPADLNSTATPQAAGSPTQAAAQSGQITYNIVPGQSKVTYQVGETFLNQNNRFNLAVGVTTQVTGTITGDVNNPSAVTLGTFQVDISQFKSDSSRRDSYIQQNGLQSSKYPIAKFVPTKIESLPTTYTEGQAVTILVTGDLTVKTTTQPVTWNVTTQLANGVITGEATTEILMSNFNVGPISLLGMLNTEDKVKLTFDFVAKP
jgi:polyisoprenoid-binding protein YceI